MPKGILEPEEAQQAAIFVAAYAGQIGKGPVVDTAGVEAARAAHLLSEKPRSPKRPPSPEGLLAHAHI